jgi:hypothetical protein
LFQGAPLEFRSAMCRTTETTPSAPSSKSVIQFDLLVIIEDKDGLISRSCESLWLFAMLDLVDV